MKMGDLELSLDDIIKKNLKKTGAIRGRNNVGNMKKPIRRISDPSNRVTKNQNASLSSKLNSRTIPQKNVRRQGPQPGIGDARMKIIQNQRQKLTDAREKLGLIAKQTDARLRLVKLREQQRGSLPGRIPMQVRPLPEPPILQRTVQSRMINPFPDYELMDYTNDVSYLGRNLPDRAIIEDNIPCFGYRSRPDASALFRTVENDLPINRLYEPEKNIYSWKKPLHMTDDISDIPVSRTSSRIPFGLRSDERREVAPSWDLDDMPIVITKKIKPPETVGILKRSSSANVFDGQAVKIIKESSPTTKSKAPVKTLSERFCQEGNPSAQKISLLKAKLEASQKANKSAGETQQPIGHRIVVSNLVPSVTHEDVKELFEDIGELISSKVVRPGTAEVVYKLHKDAVKAVDVYHNRQLDGQPMKCLLVNNKSTLAVKAKGADRKLGKGVVELDMTAFRKALHKKTAS